MYLFVRLLSLILPASTAGEGDGKPEPCASCGGRGEMEHIRAGQHRYAQVQCRTCGAAGPEVRFDLSDEWPHIDAEKTALAKWAWMQRKR